MEQESGLLSRNKNWSVIYEKAIKEDGSLFFPERLNFEFLESAKRLMGSYLFSNQYLNEVFPDEDRKFKKEWFNYYDQLPKGEHYTFAHIDPAISTEDGADYTGIVVVSVYDNRDWYVRLAERRRLNPTQIVDLVFQLTRMYGLMGIGVESVAYQKALIHLIAERMHELGAVPLKEIRRGPDKSKEMRILSLVPRFEWKKMYLRREMTDLEKELLQFPRSAHDDITDALSSIEEIAFYPTTMGDSYEPSPHSGEYESRIIKGYVARANENN